MAQVLVAGSVNMDVVARATRYPQLGETVPGTSVFFAPGGKGANQAVAAAKQSVPTRLIGRVGGDAFGRELRSFLGAQGVDLTFLADDPGAPSGTALITLIDAENAIVVVPGANGRLSEADIDAPAIEVGDVLVSQFEVPLPTLAAFFVRGKRAGARTVLNPAPAIEFDHALLDLVDILIVNETELAFLSGSPVGEDAPLPQYLAAAKQLRRHEAQIVCVTLGARGVLALNGELSIAVPGRKVTPVDTTGAGDCFVGSLAARLAEGVALDKALEYATVAASISVTREGAGPSMPTRAEVEAVLAAD